MVLVKDADWAFAEYENIRKRLPKTRFPKTYTRGQSLADIADLYDVFLLDAFGVLNVGDTVIPGAVDRISALQSAGKHVLVVTNSASFPAKVALAKYQNLGFDFTLDDVVSSRDALIKGLSDWGDLNWGVMAPQGCDVAGLGIKGFCLADDRRAYDAADGFVLLSAADWTENQQKMLLGSLTQTPRPVLVGNPDIVAPREDHLSLEPGSFAHQIADSTGIAPEFYGKPFANIYDLAFARLPQTLAKNRMLMVGDTLHTDVLGGAAAGVKTAMITSFGLFARSDPLAAISASGIVPDHVLYRT